MRILLHFLNRYYDSSTGRFLSRDPVGDGSNWFTYCVNNPLKYSDKNGLEPRPTAAPLETPWLDDGPATSISTGQVPSFPWWKFEFDLEGIWNGVKTGGAAIGSSFSFGLWDGGKYKDEYGFKEAKFFANIAAEAAYTATGLKVIKALVGAEMVIWKYARAGGGGILLLVNGARRIAIDFHKWHYAKEKSAPIWKWLHYHIGKSDVHRPWHK